MLFRQLVGNENFPLPHPKGRLGSVHIVRASTGNKAEASAVLGRTVPRFPLGLAQFYQWNKNGTWDIITLAELAAEKLLCLLKCAQNEISALPLTLPPLTRGCLLIIKGGFGRRFGSCMVPEMEIPVDSESQVMTVYVSVTCFW